MYCLSRFDRVWSVATLASIILQISLILLWLTSCVYTIHNKSHACPSYSSKLLYSVPVLYYCYIFQISFVKGSWTGEGVINVDLKTILILFSACHTYILSCALSKATFMLYNLCTHSAWATIHPLFKIKFINWSACYSSWLYVCPRMKTFLQN